MEEGHNHLHLEVVVGGIAFAETYRNFNSPGRPPDRAERGVIRALNGRKQRAVAANSKPTAGRATKIDDRGLL